MEEPQESKPQESEKLITVILAYFVKSLLQKLVLNNRSEQIEQSIKACKAGLKYK